MPSSKEEIFALQEIFGSVGKLAEYSKIRSKEAEEAIEKYNEVAKDFETFQKSWKDFDQKILEGLYKACDLADASVAIDYYYNLMFIMHRKPHHRVILFLYYTLVKEVSKQLDKSNQEWAKLTAKRENFTYDAYQKEMYLKAEAQYWDSEKGGEK